MNAAGPNYEPLMEAVVDAALFLEFSGPEAVDSDAAVAALEQLAASLGALGALEKSQLVQYIKRRAAEASDSHDRAMLASLAEGLGLASD